MVSTQADADTQDIADLVRDARIRMHVASARSIVAATIGLTSLLVFSLHDAVNRWLLGAWWLAFLVLMLLRLWYSERWASDPQRIAHGARWERRLSVVVGLGGFMWGLTGTLLYPVADSGLQPLSAIVQMGVSAAAVSSLSSMLNAYRAFFLLMTVPNMTWLAMRPSFLEHLTALALFLFTVLILINGRQVYARIDRSLRLQLDLARAVRDSEAALASAHKANEAKSLFVANISHELRTPMHAILGFAQLGKARSQQAGDEKLPDYFERIRASGMRLLSLINDLLDLSKLEAGELSLNLQRTALRPVVDAAVREFEPLLQEHALHLLVDEEDGLPPVQADSQRLGQVVRNLLSNAVKFSPRGGSIHVRLKRCQAKRESHWLQLIISDEGVGIPESELDSVFDKFVQSTKTRTGAGGTGLGLAICREIVLAHHGRIHAHNAPTGGAVLVVELPIAALQIDPEAVPSAP